MALEKSKLVVEIEAKGNDVKKELDTVKKELIETGKTTEKINSKTNDSIDKVKNKYEELAKTILANREINSNLGFDFDGIKDQIKSIESVSKNLDSFSNSTKQASNNNNILNSTQKKQINSIKKTSINVEDLNEKYRDFDNVSSDVIATMGNLGSAMSGLVDIFNLVSNIVDKITDPQIISTLKNILTIFAAIAKIRGFDFISGSIIKARDSVENFEESINSLNKNGSIDLTELADKADIVNNKFNIIPYTLSKTFGGLKKSFTSILSIFNSVNSAINDFVIFFNHANEVFLKLTDEQNLQKISKLFQALSFISKIKGNEKLSETFMNLSKNFEDFSEKVIEFNKESKEGFEKLLFVSELYNDVLQTLEVTTKGLVAAGLGYIGLGLKRTVDNLKPAFKDATNETKGFSESLKRSTTNINIFKEASKQGFNSAAKDVKGFKWIIDGLLNKSMKGLGKNFLFLTEAGSTLATALFTLGVTAFTADGSFVKFLGTLSLITALFLGGFSAAIIWVSRKIGDLLIMIGDKLIGSMDKMNSMASKSIDQFLQFSFVISGFSKAVGSEYVGNIELWNKQVEEMAETTTFSIDEIRKATKILIAEGSSMGLTVKQNTTILKTASDIASVTGKDLEDVIVRINMALMGQTQGLANLGVNLSESALEHSKLAHEMTKTISSLSDLEKQQLRYNVLLENSKPFIGAAAAATEGLIGANKQLEKSYERLQIAIGKQGKFTIMYKQTLNEILNIFLQIPEEVLYLAGSIIDFGGVVFKVIGTIFSFGITIASIATAFTVLNAIIVKSIGIQSALTYIMSKIALAVGAQTIAVTSLSAVWANFIILSKGLATVALSTIMHTLGALAIKVKNLTVLVLSNPLFWKAAFIASSIYLMVKAFEQLKKEISFLNTKIDDSSKKVSIFSRAMTRLKEIMIDIGKVGKNIFGIIATGLLQTGLFAGKALIGLKSLRAYIKGDTEELLALEMQAREVDIRMKELTSYSEDRWNDLEKIIGGTANAMENVGDSVENVTHKMTLAEKRTKQLNEELAKIDKTAIQIRVAGDEFERLKLSIREAKKEQSDLLVEFLKGSEKPLEILGKIKDAKIKELEGEESIIKLRKDSFEELKRMSEEMTMNQLKNQGLINQSIDLETKLRLEAFDKQAKKMRENFKLRKDEINLITKARQQIEDEQQKKKYEEAIKAGGDVSGTINQVGQIATQFGSQMGGVFSNVGAKLSAMAASSAASILGLILKIPEILEGVAGLIDKITDFPNLLFNAFGKVFDSLIRFVKEFIPNFIKSIPKSIVQSTEFLEGLIDAFSMLFDMLPDLFTELFDALPDMIQKFITTAISILPRIWSKLILFIIKGVPRIIKEFIKFIPELVKAILKGIVEGFNMIGKSFSNDLGKSIKEGGNKLGKIITDAFGYSSGVFAVSELKDSGVMDKAEDRVNDFIAKTKEAMWWIEKKWKELWKWFNEKWKGTWRWLDELWKGIWSAFSGMLQGIWDSTFGKLSWHGLQETWNSSFGKLSWDGLQETWNSTFGKLSWDGLQKTWDSSFGKLSWNGLKTTWDDTFGKLKDVGKDIWEGFKDGLSGLKDILQNVFDKLNPKSLIEKMFAKPKASQGTIEGKLGIDIPIISFAKGTDKVPGVANMAGDSELNDKVLALLSPGEAVIPRSAMGNPFIKQLISSILDKKIPKFAYGGFAGAVASGNFKEASKQIKGVSLPKGGFLGDLAKGDIEGALKQLDPSQLKNLSQDTMISLFMDKTVDGIRKMIFDHAGFANGGEVGRDGLAGVHRGEIVLAKPIASELGQLIKGKLKEEKPVNQEINVTFNIETTEPIDEKFMRTKIYPKLKDMLRRDSLNGKRLIQSTGVN